MGDDEARLAARAQADPTDRIVSLAKRALGELAHRDVARAEAIHLEAKVGAALDMLATRARLATRGIAVARSAVDLLHEIDPSRTHEVGAN